MRYQTYAFSIERDALQMDDFLQRYHFEERDRELLWATGRFLTEMIKVEAGLLYQDSQVVCVVTLGSLYDRIAGLVTEAEQLLLGYSMECFGMEMLTKAYERLNEIVFQETGKWMGTYHFFGAGEVEEQEQLLTHMKDPPVQWRQGMLHPSKSVIFQAAYQDRREESGCQSCERCQNVTCSFRKIQNKHKYVNQINQSGQVYSYGITRIFGGEEQ
ncbi:MAG: hypothetical protein IJ801_06545 [Lachnospiraceae bacterium]|nr:hypothetical protein [Lachnospiraceae bacterium]